MVKKLTEARRAATGATVTYTAKKYNADD